MYSVHKMHQMDDPKAIVEVLDHYPLGILISDGADGLFANHLPIVRAQEDTHEILLGHMYLKNDQLLHLQKSSRVLVIFQGPWSYVPPHADSFANAFPTMSYIAIHLSGPVKLVQTKNEKLQIVRRTVEIFEKSEKQKWDFDVPDKMLEAFLDQIVGFRIEVDKVETQFKFQQDRSIERRKSIESYFAQGGEKGQEIAAWMRRTSIQN